MREDGIRKDNKPGGLSAQTLKHHHSLLKKLFNDAVMWDLLMVNPVTKVALPKTIKKEVAFYNEEQTDQLLHALEQEEMQFQVMVLLALVTGCRRAEIAALQWSDIDFNTNEIKIERALSYVPRQQQHIKTTKTEISRKISLPEHMTNLLKKYKKYQTEKRLKKGQGKSDWLFTGKQGALLHVDTPSKQFTRFIKKHNLTNITFHGLRHTHGSVLLARGIDARTVANRLGHSETSTTLDVYSHALKSADRAAADVMNQILTKKKTLSQK